MKVSGKALFFYLSGKKNKSLVTKEVSGERIQLDEAEHKLPGSHLSGPIFLECRNFFQFPKQCKGMMCALVVPKGLALWRLGFTCRIDSLTFQIDIFVWTGPVLQHNYMLYPSFYFESCNIFIGVDQHGQPNYKKHFTMLTIGLRFIQHFRFTNQVRGHFPPYWTHCCTPRLNNTDHAFEQSLQGPDVIHLPPIHLSHQFPTLSARPKPLLNQVHDGYNSLWSIKDISATKSSRKRNRNTFTNTNVKIPPFLKMPTKPTIYDVMIDTYAFPYNETITSVINAGNFYIPFPSDSLSGLKVQRFGLFKQCDYNQVLLEIDGLPIEIFELYLDVNSSKVVGLPAIPIPSQGCTFRVYLKELFDTYVASNKFTRISCADDQTKEIGFAKETLGAHHLLEGIAVSTWATLKEGHPGQLTSWFTDLMMLCLGKGYSSWGITICRGINFYAGQRLSCQSQPSPVEGPGSQELCTYFWKNFTMFQFFPILWRIWNEMKQTAMAMALILDFHMVSFLIAISTTTFTLKTVAQSNNNFREDQVNAKVKSVQFAKQSPCEILIVTLGMHNELSFCNSPHVDAGDSYISNHLDQIEEIATWNILKHPDSRIQMNIDGFRLYALRFLNTFSLGVPTTCCYQHVKHKSDDYFHFIQFFVLQGLGCCVELKDYISHHFYAHTFVHCTSLCVAVSNGRVYVSNKDKKIGTLLGWGAGGKKKKKKSASLQSRKIQRSVCQNQISNTLDEVMAGSLGNLDCIEGIDTPII